jgi:hypothetical protein
LAGNSALGRSTAGGESSVEAELTCGTWATAGALGSCQRAVEAQPKFPATANKRTKLAVKAHIANDRESGERYKNAAGDANVQMKFLAGNSR